MKKTFLKIAVVVMAIVMLLSLGACSVPNDYKEARSNLRDNDYEVLLYDSDEYIDSKYKISYFLFIMEAMLDYDVWKELEDDLTELHPQLAKIEKDSDRLLLANDEDGENILIAIYFESTSISKEYYKLIKDVFEVAKKEGVGDYFDVSRDEITYGLNGKVVYFGTKNAVDASK